MPYIAIKAYPKDGETKRRLVDQINVTLLKTWGVHRGPYPSRVAR